MKVLDLFSGIGGFSLGLHRAGMETVAFCEIEKYPQQECLFMTMCEQSQQKEDRTALLMKMNIHHRCPVCGKVKFGMMGAGWVRREAYCQNCGSTYELTRTMHRVGLQNQEKKRFVAHARTNQNHTDNTAARCCSSD